MARIEFKKLRSDPGRGVYYDVYHTRGTKLYWTEFVEDIGNEVYMETFESLEALETKLLTIAPRSKWRLNYVGR